MKTVLAALSLAAALAAAAPARSLEIVLPEPGQIVTLPAEAPVCLSPDKVGVAAPWAYRGSPWDLPATVLLNNEFDKRNGCVTLARPLAVAIVGKVAAYPFPVWEARAVERAAGAPVYFLETYIRRLAP
jgi:hypothetical protein